MFHESGLWWISIGPGFVLADLKTQKQEEQAKWKKKCLNGKAKSRGTKKRGHPVSQDQHRKGLGKRRFPHPDLKE